MTTLTINRLSETVGAEVVELDPHEVVADPQLAAVLLEALEQNGVLVFRSLDLAPDVQVALCGAFGEVENVPSTHPVRGIFRVTLDPEKSISADALRGTILWHIDGCTMSNDEPPQKATMLSALAVAEEGGDTEFASTYAAYDCLDDAEKQRFATLCVIHTVEASQRPVWPDPTPEQIAKWRSRGEFEHPLVWTHRDGRRSLVIGASASHVVGMDRPAGRALLDDLLERATQPDAVYRHRWEVGDTVIWDNRGVLHRATPYPTSSPREMLRSTIVGDEHIR